MAFFWEYKITGDRASHAKYGVGPATDYATPWGTTIHAPFAGRIERFETREGGRSIKVIGDEWTFVVQHLESRDVPGGSTVKWRQAIATSGNTGTATTGPHAHTYIIKNSNGERIAFQEWLDWYVRNEKPSNVSGKKWFDVSPKGTYWYNHYENALNGNYDRNQIMYGGSREVVENPGTGPVRVRANDGTLVWVGTKRNPARIRG